MEKNKDRRVFSRVLTRLSWATFYRVCGENENAYKEVLAAKRYLEGLGYEDVKVAFYEGEYHLHFEIDHARQKRNRCYTVSAGHGYVNRYHVTNWENVKRFIERLEFEYSCALCRDFHDYQLFQQCADSVLFWVLTRSEYADFWDNGDIYDIPYDVSIRLWRDLRGSAIRVVDEAIANRKVVL